MNKFLHIKKNCKVCGGLGFIVSDKRLFKGEEEEDPIQCECLKKVFLYQRLDEANIPRDFFDYTMDDFKETHVEKIKIKNRIIKAIEGIDEWADKGGGFFLYGPKGTGKTMLSILILKAALAKKYSIRYDFFPMVFSDFQKAGYKADDVKDKYTNLFSDTNFMVFDELGKEGEYFKSDPAIAKRFLELNILKKRANFPTVYISNFENGLQDVERYYGQYVASMFKMNYEFLNVKDVDHRENK